MTPPRLTAVRRSQRPTPAQKRAASAVIEKAKGADDTGTEKVVADAVEQALAKLADSPAVEKVALSEFTRGGSSALADVLDMAGLAQDLTDALRTPLAGVYLAKAFNSMVDLDDATAVLNLAELEPRAIAFATAQAGKRVIQITKDIRENIATIATLGQQGQLTVGQMRTRLKAFIPMLPRHAVAAQRAFDQQRERLIRDGKTAAEAEQGAQQAFDAASTRYKRIRAEMIARTETIQASNTGRFEGWAADINDGAYSTDSRKEWVAGHKPCDVCDPSTGEVVRWDQPFENGAMMPPLHPNCRCTAVLLPPDTALRGPSSPTAGNPHQRRAQQRAEGKDPDGPSAKPHTPHKNPVSNPDAPAKVTNEDGAKIAESALKVASGKRTPEVHAAVRQETLTGQKALPVIPKTMQREADWRDFPKTRALTKDQKAAVEFYVEDRGYTELNGYLRGTRKSLKPDAAEHLAQLQQVMATQTTKRDMMVKRGQNTLTEFGKFSKPEELIGRTAVSDGFLSTAGYTSGGRFMPEAKPFREAKVRMELHVPAGTHATAANNDLEVELILAPGSKLTVVGARKEKGVTYLQVIVTQD